MIVRYFSFIVLLCLNSVCIADADGPDTWRVYGIKDYSALNIRRGPSEEFSVTGSLPYDAKGLENLGCFPQFNAAEWSNLSKRERVLAINMRWCKIRFKGRTGWVYGRYLVEH